MAGEFLLTIGNIEGLEQIHGKGLGGYHCPRFAMVGRSNVGKSSLINVLLGSRLARVSNQPGKTRNLHFYLWKDYKKIIVDLPGYGYARASHTERDRWGEFIKAYLESDEGLERVLILLDARHGPTQIDIQAIQFLSSLGIPVTFVFTKLDELKNQSEKARRRKEGAAALKDLSPDFDQCFWVSAKENLGMKELIHHLSGKQG